jgi:hypothetical protein
MEKRRGEEQENEIAKRGALRGREEGKRGVDSTEVEATAIDRQFPPPRLGGEAEEDNKNRGGEHGRPTNEEPGEQQETEEDFQPGQANCDQQRQPIGNGNPIGIHRGEEAQGIAQLGKTGEKEHAAEDEADREGFPEGHGAEIYTGLLPGGALKFSGPSGLDFPRGRRKF